MVYSNGRRDVNEKINVKSKERKIIYTKKFIIKAHLDYTFSFCFYCTFSLQFTQAYTMSTFVNAMDHAVASRTLGENGMAQLTTTTDSRVDLFFNAVRSTPEEGMRGLIDKVVAQIRSEA